MELFLPSLPLFFCFLILLITVMKLVTTPKRETSSLSRLPPGPRKLPFIGNIHQMVGLLPHQTLRNLSNKHGPLMHLQLGEVSTIVISSPEMAKEVMKTHDITFASRSENLCSKTIFYGSTDIAFSPYGNYWRQLRKICTSELLSKRRVETFKSIRDEEVSSLIRSIGLNVGAIINLTEKFASTACGITARSAFGRKTKEEEQFVAFVDEAGKLGSGLNVSDLFPSIKILPLISGMKTKLEKLHKYADRILETIINEHKTARNESIKNCSTSESESVDDLVDVLLKYQEGGDLDFLLTCDNIKAVILDIFAAGSDTSSTTADWAMAELLKTPRVMKKAQDEVRQVFDKKGKIDETDFHELKYMKLVIKEVLRLHPPLPLIPPRECREQCQINGYEIAIKTKVIVNAWAIGRDPNYWTDPDSFFPERFEDCVTDYNGTSFEYIPFGAGRRMCPGIMFGVISVETQLVHLLYHFDWILPNGMKHEDLDMTEEFATTAKRKKDLFAIPIAYHIP